MIIRKATKTDISPSLNIAKELNEWFTKEAIKNMKIDFSINNLIIATEKKEIFGFLCYSSYNSIMQLIWMGIKKDSQRKGIGKTLLKWLVKEAKKKGLRTIEVETLPDEINYEPYNLTRSFYYKNGFKRVAYKKARIKGWDDQILLEKVI